MKLQALLTTAVLAVGCASQHRNSADTSPAIEQEIHANPLADLLENEEIPGVYRVSRTGSYPADRVMVHILAVHPFAGMTDEQVDDLNQVTDNITQIIQYMHDHAGVDEVFVEGVTVADENRWSRLQDDPGYRESYMFTASLSMNEDTTQYHNIIINRILSFGLDGEVRIRAAEDLALNFHASRIVSRLDQGASVAPAVIRESWFADREHFLLEHLAECGVRNAVVIYGQRHDFRDDVLRRNEQGQSDVTLYQILPTSVLNLFDR